MESQKRPTSFTFEIDNFSEKKGIIRSPTFSSGGCEWYVRVHPKGCIVDDHLSLYLFVANTESLRLGWKIRASVSFVLLNQSGKELFKTAESPCKLFCSQVSGWGTTKALPLKKLQEKGFLEKNKLIVKVEVKVVEVVDEGDVTGKETLDIRGFQILYSKVLLVGRLFTEHPDIALNLRLTNQFLKTTYMNIVLGLIETLNKPPHDISETELSNAGSELNDLTEVGFKLDWLKTKLDEVSLERKKSNVQVQELEEHIKNLTLDLNKEKGKADTSAAEVLSLEKTVSDLEYELNKEKLESDSSAAKVLLLEQTVLDLKEELFDLNEKLQKEKQESYTYAAKANSLEQTMWDLKYKVFDLKEELHKETKEYYTCAAEVISLEQTVMNLKDELKEEKGKSDTSAAKVLSFEQIVSEYEEEVSDLKDELNKEKGTSDSSAAKVLLLEQTVSDLEDELNKEKGKSDTFDAKVLSLEQTMSDLEDVLNKEMSKSDTFSAKVLSLEQTVLNLRAELKNEKAAVCSWEVLDYEDLRHEK
ncbi:unnamed protein product [Microthlaspi erraticum]|uniref:MATH domain-containing protein n=1 Tax=Microthlaspi erraticum TaxID=1685480 RepID=A0A6D2K5R6_9BRAS|nr:unnamed protein product [Microthlaspi erraticum]